ncbi:MAG: serine/threonine-protein phosphatase [Lachnospiraceae bacterium]|nr:serine/threonine-protein phosphatase [Lachnospiraceae bacterium]
MKSNKEQRRVSIILQVAILFIIGILSTGVLTFFSEKSLSGQTVKKQMEGHAREIAEEVRQSVREYTAYPWLLEYWYTHADTMEVEYDTTFAQQGATYKKSQLLAERHPEIQGKYAQISQLEALPEEDQKLYAEICYAWVITRINEIKQAYHIDFLFCVVTEEPYDTQFFMLSAADPGAVRGTNYEEVYPLGHTVTVGRSQQEAMRNARINEGNLADAGDYVDYYAYLCPLGEHTALIGLTYTVTGVEELVVDQTRAGTKLAIINQVMLSLLCLLLIYLFVLRPLKKVQGSIRLYTETKDSETVIDALSKVNPWNEIGQLSQDVSDMIREIDNHVERIQTITAERERIGAELSLATRIQSAMLPHTFPAFPDRHEFDIYASMDPAKAVGGDFYDFFLIDEDHLCMVIADVSGKGVPAALFMMAAKIILQSCAMLGSTAAEILTKTNEAICSNNQEQMFVTVWVGILEISTGRLTAANAGHEYPAVKNPDGSFELLKDRHGMVIGGMEGVTYKEYELQMEPGSALFLYTDGVAEATDAEKNMFGTARMLEALNKEAGAAPEQLIRNVQEALDDFVREEEQFDDVTMLCMVYQGDKKA